MCWWYRRCAHLCVGGELCACFSFEQFGLKDDVRICSNVTGTPGIHVQWVEIKSVRIGILSPNSRLFRFKWFFQPSFWNEVNYAENLFTISYLVTCVGIHMPKKKVQENRHTRTDIHTHRQTHKQTHTDKHTNTHTHKHTHTHTHSDTLGSIATYSVKIWRPPKAVLIALSRPQFWSSVLEI